MQLQKPRSYTFSLSLPFIAAADEVGMINAPRWSQISNLNLFIIFVEILNR